MKNKSSRIENIEFKDLTFGYEKDNPIFEGVSFEFPIREATWVKSTGGLGKSVLLKLLAGLIEPQSGNYLINGREVNKMSFNEFVPYNLNIGYSFDYGGLLSNRTVYENLALPLQYHGTLSGKDIKQRVEEYIESFHLTDVAHQRPSKIPGGMRKNACVVRSLIMRPEMLLLDDPTMGLRNEPRRALMNYLKENLTEDGHIKHLFIVSQDLKFIDKTCSHILEISKKGFACFEKVQSFYPTKKGS